MKKLLEEYSVMPQDLFKRIFVIGFFAYIPLLLLQIILNLSGTLPLNFNDEKVYGVEGVVVLVLFSPLLVLLFTLVTWIHLKLGIFVMRFINKIL